MALGTTPVARSAARAPAVAWPSLFEAALVLAAIAALLPLYQAFEANDAGRDRRFADDVLLVRGLPPPVLPSLCATHAREAEPLLRDRLCRAQPSSVTTPADRMPSALSDAHARTKAAFAAPLRSAQARVTELRLREREGLGDPSALRQAIAAADAQIKPYVARYSMESGDALPAPLACAFELVDLATVQNTGDRAGANRDARRANALLLLAAAFDGNPAASTLASSVLLPAVSKSARRPCMSLGIAGALAKASAIMVDARQASLNNLKNQAMRALLRTAGWQWAGWMLIGLVLVNLSRRSGWAIPGVALALAAWAAAAWIGRVPGPLAMDRAFVPARETLSPLSMPATFVIAMLIASLIVLAAWPWLRRRITSTSQTMASRIGYPGLVLATGVGWLLLLDLSSNASPGNRYLALYHQGHLWLAMVILSVVAFLRQPLGQAVAWTLSMIEDVAGGIAKRFGAVAATALAVALAAALLVGVASSLTDVRQLTSEIGRLWLMLGAAWFFFLRGTPFAERLARSDSGIASLVRYVWPLVFVVAVLIGAMLVTRDMGPLLIAGYGAGAFLAASVAMWLHQRVGTTRVAFALAVMLFVGWILAVTLALFKVGSLDPVTAARLENVAAPLASANDQLAVVTWFQQVAPPAGFGLGAVPWCGYGGSIGCAGVPAQIHSDYTFTAIVGAFGWTAAWALTLGCAVWLHRLIRHHGRVTRGEPRLVARGGRLVSDDQAFLSWLCLAWVVLTLCQLAVTVAGNLAVIPLTGVTFPFVSFGMTSLLANSALLALCLNVNAPARVVGAP